MKEFLKSEIKRPNCDGLSLQTFRFVKLVFLLSILSMANVFAEVTYSRTEEEKVTGNSGDLLKGSNVQYEVNNRQILLSSKTSTRATDEKIKGKVTDEKGESLPGVSIVIKGSTKGVITDIDGEFSIEAEPNDILKFTFVGMTPKEIIVGTQTILTKRRTNRKRYDKGA